MKYNALIPLALLVPLFLTACGDECSSYSDYSCKEIETAEYNVYYYFPSGSEEFLGQTTGLAQCGAIAWDFTHQKNLEGKDWGYICCMIAKGSSCYEKHR